MIVIVEQIKTLVTEISFNNSSDTHHIINIV